LARKTFDPTAVWFGMAGGCVVLLVGLALALAWFKPWQQEQEAPPPRAKAEPPPKKTRRSPARKPRKPVPGRPAESAIDRAVAKGVAYLKSQQKESGTWGEVHPIGMAGLCALALLESGVPATDPVLQKALDYVRDEMADLDKTYELALAILLLDRLGREEDRDLIQTLALRLIAGQTPAGGWSYTCPVLPQQSQRKFLLALQQMPARGPGVFVQGPNGRALGDLFTPKPRPAIRPAAAEEGLALPERLRKTPALRPVDKDAPFPDSDESDNSNTQFAVLGLWTARRHYVPVDRALALVVRRFRNSQKPTGGWGYLYQTSQDAAESWDTTTPSMTAAGLLALAVGWGLAGEAATRKGRDEPLSDPGIRKGLTTIGGCIGTPTGKPVKPGEELPPLDIYYLWSLERVGVLFKVKTLGDKDWYAWGSEQLLGCQRPNGAWETEGYRGATAVTDTCLALLFLKRADLTGDLSRQIEQLDLIRTK
jgi:hypothetical protein